MNEETFFKTVSAKNLSAEIAKLQGHGRTNPMGDVKRATREACLRDSIHGHSKHTRELEQALK